MTIQPRLVIFGVSSIYKNIVSSESIWPIELNFYMKTPYDKLGKIYTNCFGHMTIMADMPIYGKTPLKSSQEPGGPCPWDLVFSITDIGPTKFVKTMILG